MSVSISKPVYRVTTDGNTIRPVYRTPEDGNTKSFVGDGFENLSANTGMRANNLTASATYTLNPLSRNHVKLEFMYRGTWIVRQVVDAPANDMTRQGTIVESDMPPDAIDKLHQYWNSYQVWKRLNSTIKWARLYGGALAVIMIDGQDPQTPLDLRSIGRGMFKGLLVLDRWMVWADTTRLVRDLGVDFGKPEFYQTVADARSIPNMRIHHSRCIRIEGIELPYFQKLAENEWGLSVIEPFFDRMVAYDSATSGAAQLLYRACLRIIKVEGFRDLVGMGGPLLGAFQSYMQWLKLMQQNEGMTVIDNKDDFVMQTYTFAGISDMLVQFGQQLSGAAQIPLTRLFGQAPAGLNATGESDMRNYYDGIGAEQETSLRPGITTLYDITHRSLFGKELPEGFNFSFRPLYQLNETEKAAVAVQITNAVDSAKASGLITKPSTLLKELRQWSRVTGLWSNITDEDIKEADQMEPPMPEMGGGQGDLFGQQGQGQGQGEVPGGMQGNELAPGEQGQQQDNGTVHRFEFTSNDHNLSMVEVGGFSVVVETHKDTRRYGHGWSVMMPCDYGYISGTSSAEGAGEQMDAFVGPDTDSDKVWVIEQVEPGSGMFDEHKVMLGFNTREEAVGTYVKAFNDGLGEKRIGSIKSMSLDKLKEWLSDEWQYGKTPSERRGLRLVS